MLGWQWSIEEQGLTAFCTTRQRSAIAPPTLLLFPPTVFAGTSRCPLCRAALFSGEKNVLVQILLPCRGLCGHHSQQSDEPWEARRQFSSICLSNRYWFKLWEFDPKWFILAIFKHSKIRWKLSWWQLTQSFVHDKAYINLLEDQSKLSTDRTWLYRNSL